MRPELALKSRGEFVAWPATLQVQYLRKRAVLMHPKRDDNEAQWGKTAE
jgi:hypothetical protein